MPLILGTNSIKDTGYDVANSLRFNSGSSDSLTRSTTAGNRTTWTFSTWFKRSKLGVLQSILEHDDANYFRIRITSGDVFEVFDSNGNNTWNWHGVLRDTSSWYSIILRGDSTDGTNNNRLRLYINGTLASANTVASISQNYTFSFNQGGTLQIGKRGSTDYLDGYLAETILIDGSALAPDQFGEFDEDSGIWKPIDVSGLTFGTRGFYLDFENSGSLGADVSGNGNNFTVNNLTSIDQTTDTPTNNFCTANPLHTGSGSVSNAPLSDGNLTFTSSQAGSPYPYYFSTFAASQGKWYAEFKVTTANSAVIGIGTGAATGFLGAGLYDYAYYYDGTFYNNGGNTGSQSSYTNGDIISVAMDLDNNKVYVAKNNTWQHSGDPSAGTGGYTITAPASQTGSTATGVYHIAYGDAGGGTPAIQGNFGNPPFTISSGNSDGDGYGNFEYAVPSGYYALNSKNLAEYG